MDSAHFRELIVTYRNGAPIRLGELGNIFDGIQQDKEIAWFNDSRAIQFQVQRQPGTNTVQVVDRIRELLPEFQKQLPPALKLDVVYDRSQSIRESVNDVKNTLLITVCLVVMVIFLFPRCTSSTTAWTIFP